MNSTEDAMMGGGYYSLEGFPFQTCNQQKLRMVYTHTGVRIYSFIHTSLTADSIESLYGASGECTHADTTPAVAAASPTPAFSNEDNAADQVQSVCAEVQQLTAQLLTQKRIRHAISVNDYIA